MEEYNSRILKAKQVIKNADYILIGAGAGLSTAGGLEYSGENFEKNYKEFIVKYRKIMSLNVLFAKAIWK